MICPHCGHDTRLCYVRGGDVMMRRDELQCVLVDVMAQIRTLEGLGCGDPDRQVDERLWDQYQRRVRSAMILAEALGI